MEDGKERDPNQSSCEMDGAERYGEEEGKEEGRHSIGVEVLRGMQEEGRSVRKERWIWVSERWWGLKWAEVRYALGLPSPPATAVQSGLGTAHCPAAVCPMSPVKRGRIWGLGKAIGSPFPAGCSLVE